MLGEDDREVPVAGRVAAGPLRMAVCRVAIEGHLPAPGADNVVQRLREALGAPQRLPVRERLRERRALDHPPLLARGPGPSVVQTHAPDIRAVVEQVAVGPPARPRPRRPRPRRALGRRLPRELLLELPHKRRHVLAAERATHDGESPLQEVCTQAAGAAQRRHGRPALLGNARRLHTHPTRWAWFVPRTNA